MPLRSYLIAATAYTCLVLAVTPASAQQDLWLYVGSARGDDVSIIDMKTFKVVGDIKAGERVHGVCTDPDGKRLFSEESLLARRAPQVAIGESFAYGMGLFINNKYGTPIISHGGDLIGFHSDMFWLPEHDVGGVILTNADGGSLLRGPFIRKVLEELFDGKTEAMEDVENAAKRRMAEIAKARERLVVPPDPAALAMLAPRYANNALGLIDVRPSGSGQVFDFGEWKSAVASRKNDDGTISFITIAPGVGGFEFVVAERDGRRALVLRDLQHEYVCHEQS